MEKPRFFTLLEIAKMPRQLEDAMTKINKVCDGLQKAGDIKNFIILIRASQNLMRVYGKLEGKPKRPRKRLIEKAKRILAEKTWLKIPAVGILRGSFCEATSSRTRS